MGILIMEKELVSRRDNLIVYLVFGIPMLVLIGFVFYTMLHSSPKNELMMKDDLNENFTGRVDSFYFDESNHNGKYGVLNNKEVCPIVRSWEHYIKIGDSLSKKKGSFFLENL